ncbi:MAG: flagellar basal body-associated FliL family protein [Verrucomicrobia bacterium]|nr:flagellar basal body-associated FliL family protein [Verrucomicrobiota bacterium]
MADAPKETTSAKGGAAAWLPLIVMLVGMPAMAFVMTNFLLLPKLKAELGAGAPAGHEESAKPEKAEKHDAGKSEGGHGAKEAKSSSKEAPAKEGVSKGGPRSTYQLTKVLVNVAGSAGARYLIANYTLVGSSSDFKSKLDERKDQLLDVAIGVMGTKSIADLEKPGARNLIRNELMSAWNTALGGNVVKEIYITEFAIQ